MEHCAWESIEARVKRIAKTKTSKRNFCIRMPQI
jgi:hypothetical protein